MRTRTVLCVFLIRPFAWAYAATNPTLAAIGYPIVDFLALWVPCQAWHRFHENHTPVGKPPADAPPRSGG